MNRSNDEIQRILSTFSVPDRAAYPELQEYSRDDLYRDFFGGEGLYLAIKMVRTLRLLTHLKPGGQLCLGSEALSAEFTPEQITNPPSVYAFKLPPPNERVDVFNDDFVKQHTPGWWRDFFQASGLLKVDTCQELEYADAIYEELVSYEHEHQLDPFDVQICLD